MFQKMCFKQLRKTVNEVIKVFQVSLVILDQPPDCSKSKTTLIKLYKLTDTINNNESGKQKNAENQQGHSL